MEVVCTFCGAWANTHLIERATDRWLWESVMTRPGMDQRERERDVHVETSPGEDDDDDVELGIIKA